MENGKDSEWTDTRNGRRWKIDRKVVKLKFKSDSFTSTFTKPVFKIHFEIYADFFAQKSSYFLVLIFPFSIYPIYIVPLLQPLSMEESIGPGGPYLFSPIPNDKSTYPDDFISTNWS